MMQRFSTFIIWFWFSERWDHHKKSLTLSQTHTLLDDLSFRNVFLWKAADVKQMEA